VLTGYLIGKSLLKTDTIRYIYIYNRIIRIVPTLTIVVGLVSIISYKVLPIARFDDIENDTKSSLLFYQDFNLASKSNDYFDLGKPKSPLEHLWYIATSEQAVLIMILLMIVFVLFEKFVSNKKFFVISITILTIASFIYSIWYSIDSPNEGYYLLQTRFWEVGVGCLVSLLGLQLCNLKQATRRLFIGFTIVGLLICWFTLDGKNIAFPGTIALVPVVLTIVLIITQSKNNRLYKIKPVSFIAKISYSLYLVHFPILQISLQSLLLEDTIVNRLVLLVASIIVATFLTYTIEKLFIKLKPKVVLTLFLTLIIFSGVFFGTEFLDKRASGTVKKATKQFNTFYKKVYHNPTLCYGANSVNDCSYTGPKNVLNMDFNTYYTFQNKFHYGKTKIINDKTRTKTIVLFGDSHIRQYANVFKIIANKNHYNLIINWDGSCMISPKSFKKQVENDNDKACKNNRSAELDDILTSRPEIVIISSATSDYKMNNKSNNYEFEDFVAEQAEVLDQFKKDNIKTIVLRDNPNRSGYGLDSCYRKKSIISCQQLLNFHTSPDINVEAAKITNTPIMDLTNILCPATTNYCPIIQGGIPIYYDNSHLTKLYTATLKTEITNQLSNLLNTSLN
jgi:peptidoglycan/LPS O-acetylase OafA/YrhL